MRIDRVLAASALACLAVFLTSSAALGHEYWLAPSSYLAAAGDTIRLTAFVGTGFQGEIKPYAAPRAIRFAARSASTADLRKTSINGDFVFGRAVARDDRGVLVAYESNYVPIELEAADFDRYLAIEGLDGPRAERAKLASPEMGRERYARCPKAWISGSAADAKRASAPYGLTLELIPRGDPGRPGPLRLELLYRGKPLGGALVRAWRQPLDGHVPRDAATRDSVGPVAQGRTAADGTVTLALDGDGEWLVSTVHMVRCPDPRLADWESHWASLTFARSPRRAPRGR